MSAELYHTIEQIGREKGLDADIIVQALEEAYAAKAWNVAKVVPEKVPPLEELKASAEKSEQRKKEKRELPYAEVDPSGRAKCKHCDEKIEEGAFRVVLLREVRFGNQIRGGPINVHPKCVAAELRAEDCMTEVEGFEGALRANTTDLDADQLNSLVAEIGELDG